jgi:hypothetical protein
MIICVELEMQSAVRRRLLYSSLLQPEIHLKFQEITKTYTRRMETPDILNNLGLLPQF